MRSARAIDPRSRTVVIEPGRGTIHLGLRELWESRELGYFLVWRDLKVRYKQTAFGAAWALLQPLLLMVVFSIFLGRVSGIAPSGIPYPLFVLSGLVPWTLFSQSVLGSSASLVNAANLLQKVYFPRLLLPIAAIASYLLDFAIAMVLLGLLMLYFGVAPTLTVLWLIPLTVLALAASLAAGIWLSAVNVRYRDVRHAVPFLLQLWLFASPIAYAADLVPSQWQILYRLNPMAGVVEGFRWALLGPADPPLMSVGLSALVSVLALAIGLIYFRRVERTFADVI
jgi:lipopolysaccharide transport system permease protein